MGAALAKGEGNLPCSALLSPTGLLGGEPPGRLPVGSEHQFAVKLDSNSHKIIAVTSSSCFHQCCKGNNPEMSQLQICITQIRWCD
ncbi:hypothetical protein AV530_008194 [Patagioenas fasciata monilis]|uniref:Uncharacterized protein n=1 Tax=Patagioenas fasciata monilis TaxID=372326 RepID=A0A1V4KUM7_PATFA|nr:hypothetical protein AV530_008194 [Patagioenas fasciata monilis]